MKDKSIDLPTRGDSIRGIAGALASLIGISLALSQRLPGRGMAPQIGAVAVLGLIAALWQTDRRLGLALGHEDRPLRTIHHQETPSAHSQAV